MTLREYINNTKTHKKIHIKRILAALLYLKSYRTIENWCRKVPLDRRADVTRVTGGRVTKFD